MGSKRLLALSVHEQAESKWACNIFNFVVVCFLRDSLFLSIHSLTPISVFTWYSHKSPSHLNCVKVLFKFLYNANNRICMIFMVRIKFRLLKKDKGQPTFFMEVSTFCQMVLFVSKFKERIRAVETTKSN
jgi:hypothetical protein